MKDTRWTFNLIIHSSITIAIYQVSMFMEETDKFLLARKVVEADIMDEKKLLLLLDKIGPNYDKPIKMTEEEILLMYTLCDVYSKMMISVKGDIMREHIYTAENPNAKIGFDSIFEGLAHFTRNLYKGYKHLPEFRVRKGELEKLNEFL